MEDAVMTVAKLMVVSAVTAPKGRGENYITSVIVDGEELEKLITHFRDQFNLSFDRRTVPPEEEIPSRAVPLPPLPNLAIRSTMVLVFLYGLLTVILITLTLYTRLTPFGALIIGIAIAVIQFLLGPYITDLSLRWFYKMAWIDYGRLPVYLRTFIVSTCKNNNMKNPRMGVIYDGAPNAFTYGHTPNNARIVLTRGKWAIKLSS